MPDGCGWSQGGGAENESLAAIEKSGNNLAVDGKWRQAAWDQDGNGFISAAVENIS